MNDRPEKWLAAVRLAREAFEAARSAQLAIADATKGTDAENHDATLAVSAALGTVLAAETTINAVHAAMLPHPPQEAA